jgi:hypothetical protein
MIVGEWRSWVSWRKGLLGVVKCRGVGVYLLGTLVWQGQRYLRGRRGLDVTQRCRCISELFLALLTARGTALLEKLTGSQLVKKFPAFYGTRRFITALTSVRHLSVSGARSILSMSPIPLPESPSYYCPPIYAWVFQVASFPQVSPPKTCMHFSPPYVLQASLT